VRQQPAPLPKEIRIPRSGVDLSGRKTRTVFFIALITLIAVLAVAWKMFRSGPSLSAPIIAQVSSTSSTLTPPTSTGAPPPTIQVSINPILTMTPVFVLTSASDASPTLITGRNQLEVPIGTDYKFVIHLILEGETMEGLAAKYHTSTEAIVAVNYIKRNPGWSGTLLVIPLDFVDFAKLPSFIVYRVQEKDRGISVDGMAKYLHVTPLNLKYYNGWTDEGDRPLVGDYLLVPRPRPVQ